MGERNHLLPSPPGGEGSGERWNAKEDIEITILTRVVIFFFR
jgi:hypothetical protein